MYERHDKRNITDRYERYRLLVVSTRERLDFRGTIFLVAK